jgi:hypothetical protein
MENYVWLMLEALLWSNIYSADNVHFSKNGMPTHLMRGRIQYMKKQQWRANLSKTRKSMIHAGQQEWKANFSDERKKATMVCSLVQGNKEYSSVAINHRWSLPTLAPTRKKTHKR